MPKRAKLEGTEEEIRRAAKAKRVARAKRAKVREAAAERKRLAEERRAARPVYPEAPIGRWMAEHGITEADIETECGISQPTMNRARKGKPVRLGNAIMLYFATGRQVPIEAMVPPAVVARARKREGCLLRLVEERKAGVRKRPRRRLVAQGNRLLT